MKGQTGSPLSISRAAIALAFALGSLPLLALGPAMAAPQTPIESQAAQTTPPNAVRSVYDCVYMAKLPKAVCIDAFDDAYDVYRERTPRYKTRAECNALYKVCVVFNPPSYGGRPPPPLKPAEVTYAPPFLAVVLSPGGEALQVLIDTTRKPLIGGVPQRTAPDARARPPSFAGTNFAPPAGAFIPRKRGPDGRYADAPNEVGGSALEGGGPAGDLPIDAPGVTSLDGVSSYPVPESRRRKRSP